MVMVSRGNRPTLPAPAFIPPHPRTCPRDAFVERDQQNARTPHVTRVARWAISQTRAHTRPWRPFISRGPLALEQPLELPANHHHPAVPPFLSSAALPPQSLYKLL